MFFIKKFFEDNETWNLIGTASVMGLHIVSGTAVGFAIGWYLDKWFGTKPWLLLIFLILGIVAGFMNMFRDGKKLYERKKNDNHAQNDEPKP